MKLPQTPSASSASHGALDQLVVTLDSELAALQLVHFRLAVLRLVLLDGNPAFIQAASNDVELAARIQLEKEPERDRVIAAARSVLGFADLRLADVVAQAPESHRPVLHRLSSELDSTSRAIGALRDAVRRLAEDGRRAVLDVLDLTEPSLTGTADPSAIGRVFIGEF